MKRSGFTMIELMVVTLFLSVIGVYTWTYLRTTLNTQKIIEEKTSLQQSGIAVINKIREDVSQVFFVESSQKLTFFKGDEHSLSFTALSHDSAAPESHESDQAEISYSLEADKEDPKTQVLMRKEVAYLDGDQEKNTDIPSIPMAKQIGNLEFSYSQDAVKFNPDWDITAQDHLNKLPKLIKVVLTMKDTKEREELFETLVELPMSEDLNYQNAAAKTPGGDASKNPAQKGKTTQTNPQNPATTPPVNP